MSSLSTGTSKAKGKDTNSDSPDKDDSGTTVFDEEDNDAGNRIELANDATASATKALEATLTSIPAAIGEANEDVASRFNSLDNIRSSFTDH